MHALIDADILRYEIGFAAEAAIKATSGDKDALPQWEYVEECLHHRIEELLKETGSDSYTLYLTEGRTFRDKIATVKPYKGSRIPNKPWHYDNLTVHMVHMHPSNISRGIEADDAIAMEHRGREDTIVCSRDKDLRQLPGWLYSWELGLQPSFGPAKIENEGSLELSEKGKLSGTGLSFFHAQCLMGDSVDNIPGIPGTGPVAAYKILEPCLGDLDVMEDAVLTAYYDHYGDTGEEMLLEQGRLLWLVRQLNEDGSPKMWEIGMRA